MATVEQIAKASLSKILVQPDEAPLEPSEYQSFILNLNALMLDLDANGVTLGYTEVTNLGDEVTIPTGALRGVINLMAIEMAPEFNATVTPALAQVAEQGRDTLQLIGGAEPTTRYPSTLPIGSGNEGPWAGTYIPHFYPETEQEILAETNGPIALERSTEDIIDGGGS